MRYGLIADIHANIDALRVVLDDLAKENVSQILCLGDLVGYNAAPGGVLDLAMKPGIVSINGNHDRYVTGVTPPDPSIKKDVVVIINWTMGMITPSQHQWLEALPRQRVIDDTILMVHGSPRHEDEYMGVSPDPVRQYKENIQFVSDNFIGIGVTFFGHTHLPAIVARGTLVTAIHQTKTFKLESDRVYLINPGSVGQPRDRCPLASFGVYDSEERTVTVKRVEYDIKAAQEKVLAAGFSPRMAERLEKGQ